jgi:hypothetical protein
MAQLAEWITALEPHFVQVWIVQAWNMAYNISVKFSDYNDRWRWVERGIALLRDEGLKYNPNETLIYRELAWFFQHKMGQTLDDAQMVYKQEWANEMAEVFAKQAPNLEELIHPQTDDQKTRARLLREKFKMDPEFMKEVNDRYGPLEWRLPEAHAIYWAALGLKKAQENPTKIKQDDLITLRRAIYQSMQISFQRGRLIANPYIKKFEFGPNLDIIPKVSAAYEQAAQEDVNNHDHILTAHRNFLRDAVYFLYVNNRLTDAAYWYKYLSAKYPQKPLIESQPNSYPANLTLDDYAVSKVQEDVSETMAMDRIRAIIEGLLQKAYVSTAIGQDEAAAGYALLAEKVRTTYASKTSPRKDSIPMAPLEDIKRDVTNRMLDPQEGVPEEMRKVLRVKLGLPEEAPQPPGATNAAPDKVSSR